MHQGVLTKTKHYIVKLLYGFALYCNTVYIMYSTYIKSSETRVVADVSTNICALANVLHSGTSHPVSMEIKKKQNSGFW